MQRLSIMCVGFLVCGGLAGCVEQEEDLELSTADQMIGLDHIRRITQVLSGGEIPALALVDAIARRLPGALTGGSGEIESFSSALDGGLEYPHYTRPAEFRGWEVPEVLLSGNHARIADWRREQSRARTPS